MVDNRTVEDEGEEYSLTKLAKLLTGKENELQGPKYYIYEGEILDERRKRIEGTE